jgi:hypothetical protein
MYKSPLFLFRNYPPKSGRTIELKIEKNTPLVKNENVLAIHRIYFCAETPSIKELLRKLKNKFGNIKRSCRNL